MLAKKMIHSNKSFLGTTIHMDEIFRVIGTSRKGLFGEEIFLDSNGRYAGSKRKGILGEENYFDQDGHLVAATRDSFCGIIPQPANGNWLYNRNLSKLSEGEERDDHQRIYTKRYIRYDPYLE